MAGTLAEAQKEQLRRIWLECGGLERLAEGFAGEIAFFLEQCPPLITEGNKKIETEESRGYANVAKQCDKLLKALEGIPELDRLNRLSLRGHFPGIVDAQGDSKSVPLCDPLEYLQALQEQAARQSQEVKRYAKHERQLSQLRHFLNRFPPMRQISRESFIELAGELWPEVNLESFRKAYR